MEVAPSDDEIRTYAGNLCSAFNAFATEEDDLVLRPDRFATLEGDLVVVRFVLDGRTGEQSEPEHLERGLIGELGSAPLGELGGGELPYLKPSKSLRLYVERFVYMLKPAQYRCFSPAAGQSDGDRIVADLMNSVSPVAPPAVSA
jgi:hypothetical protein